MIRYKKGVFFGKVKIQESRKVPEIELFDQCFQCKNIVFPTFLEESEFFLENQQLLKKHTVENDFDFDFD